MESSGGDAGVDGSRRNCRVLRHQTHRADLALTADVHADVDDAPEPNRHVVPEGAIEPQVDVCLFAPDVNLKSC